MCYRLSSRCRVRADGGQAAKEQAGYSLQAEFKIVEGNTHPDWDAQFCYLDTHVERVLAASVPLSPRRPRTM